MNILFATGHPAQIHGFRNLKFNLEDNGHNVFWIATNKDISKYLLEYYKIDYYQIRKPGKSIFSKIYTLLLNTICSLRYIKNNKIDITFSRISPYISIACFLLKKTHFGLTDTESAGFYDKFFSQFISVLFTAESFKRQLRSDQIRFKGNIELFYLHPKRFKPQSRQKVSELLGIKPNIPFVIMRFVSWDAFHDKGLTGFSDENKIKAIEAFSQHARVFISSEKPLPCHLGQYAIRIPPEKMHDVLSHATMFFGESATMASESAMLGTPAVYLSENWYGSTEEEEKYGLLYSYKECSIDQTKAILKGIELLSTFNLELKIMANRNKFLENKIDVTGFLLWFIENFPESLETIRKDPDIQDKFA